MTKTDEIRRDEIRREVRELREKLGMSQAEFAAKLEVQRPNVSEWESEHPNASGPSNASLIRMGNLAPWPKNIWFYEQAGLERDKLLGAAKNLLEERKVDLNQTIALARVPPIQESLGFGHPWMVLETEIPNPGAVGYWEGRGNGVLAHPAGYRGAPDDEVELARNRPYPRVLLDLSEYTSATLEPFWDRPLLIEMVDLFTPEEEAMAALPRLHDSETGFHSLSNVLALEKQDRRHVYLGELRLKQYPRHNDRYAVLFPYAPIDPNNPASDLWQLGGIGGPINQFVVGHWKFAESVQGPEPLSENLIDARAKKEMRLLPGCRILGRAIACFWGHALETKSDKTNENNL